MDMFYIASKVGWLLLMPSNLLIFLLLAAIALRQFQRTGLLGRRVGFATIVVLVVVTLVPVGDAMLRPLEHRFPPLTSCNALEPGSSIAGILLLGGALGSTTNNGRAQDNLHEGADRIRFAASLARAHPEALLLISGGQAFPLPGSRSEAEATADSLGELGVARERLIIETASRTTAENAAFAAEQAGANGRWLLVTSAFHMPRAIGTFRAVGLDVIAAPTDWQVDERSTLLSFSVSERLLKLDTAAKEYVGLMAYWVTGRTGALFPGPSSSDACQ